MKKIIMVLTILCLFVVGCSKKEDTSSYDKHLGDGIIAAANEEYDKAKELFSLAKDEKSNEAEAYALYKEVQKALSVLTEKDNIFLLSTEQLSDLFDVVNYAIKYTGE